MRAALVGPELEENLGLRYLHASLSRAGHQARILDFHEASQIPSLVASIMDHDPDLVGLSMVFTGRAREYLDLALELRRAGYAGHVTAGGHFASFHAHELLSDHPCLDTIVHGDGEEAIVELIESLDDPSHVPGLTHRRGAVSTTQPRRNPDDLDSRPWPTRPERLHSYLGLPIANMLSSRGCYGNCSYCSIHAWFKQTRGRRLRQRSVSCVAEEMASLYHHHGARIFNFHDDNFFVRDPSRNLERFRALGEHLSSHGLGRIALQVKARPDSVDVETFSLLKDMGLFRVFLGVETNAAQGLKTLGRRSTREQNLRALSILRDLAVHTSFNLLVFDPETVLSDLWDNISFMRAYADMPLNFGRVEVYSGTPLEKTLRVQDRLLGTCFGYTYRISDARVQRAFEMYKRVFLPRNFSEQGTNLLAMKVDYFFHLLAHFHPERATSALRRRAKRLITEVNTSSAELMSEICDFLSTGTLPPPRESSLLASELAARREAVDAGLAPRMHALVSEICNLASHRRSRLLAAAASASALVLTVTVTACRPKAETERPLPPPPDKPVVEKPPEPEPEPAEPPVALTDEQIDSIEERIAERYQEDINKIVEDYGYKDKKITLDLVLDASGAVESVEIDVPTDVKIKSFEKELEKMVEEWVFDDTGHPTSCTITIEWVKRHDPGSRHGTKKPKPKPKPPEPPDKPPEWHMCEMMMEPME